MSAGSQTALRLAVAVAGLLALGLIATSGLAAPGGNTPVQGIVIGVSAVGNTKQVDGDDDPNDYLKSYYSSYGVGVTDVTAPGGDFFYGRGTDAGPFGLVVQLHLDAELVGVHAVNSTAWRPCRSGAKSRFRHDRVTRACAFRR